MANKNLSVQDSISNAMGQVFSAAASATIEGIESIEKKDGGIVPVKEYNFVNPIGKRTTMKTFNPAIIESTEKIALALYGQNVLEYAVCREMAKMNDKKLLDEMGFKNIAEYASAMFDISRVTATQYARIGEVFISDDYTIKSTVLPSGLRKGHLVELLSYVGEEGDISDIEGLYMDGTLTDGMSTKVMRATLKDWKNGTLAIETTGEEIPEIEDRSAGNSEEKSAKTASSEKSEAKEVGFDVQKEVGKILSACNEITEAFDALNRHEFNVGGYEKALDEIRALANAMLQ